MTIQHRVISDIRDLKAIRINCKCGASISFVPDKDLMLPSKCHSCHKDWPAQNDFGTAYKTIIDFTTSLKKARELNEIVAIALELELPMEEKPAKASASPDSDAS